MRLLLIVSGGIAAYKSLEFVRLARKAGYSVRAILTAGGAQFITPLSLASLSEHKVYTDLFSLTDESEMGHIRLARTSDLVVIAPASADLIGKIANGLADDLASTLLLANDKPVLLAPAMNGQMWKNPALQKNLERLRERHFHIVGPGSGDLACGEMGEGRMAEPEEILTRCDDLLRPQKILRGLKALVTSGPTREAIDPVRYISNHSSGKQGHAIAEALAKAGAETILISGPVDLPDPVNCRTIHVTSADEMLSACQEALPVDIAICAAAVADWKIAEQNKQKIKKANNAPPKIDLVPNPDILAHLSAKNSRRPALVIGFAAETEKLITHAQDKLVKKGCDWILANDVSGSVFGGEENEVTLITDHHQEQWPKVNKTEIARKLVGHIAKHFERT